ncbi:MAG TPA: c-type cytochrome [Membranihabitans sp.]|nr:c-type cytochrome [Membranihabitans sp.]
MYQPFKYILVVLALLLVSGEIAFGQGGDVELGSSLFRTNCAQCHNRDMKSDLTGPALGPSLEAWAQYPQEDLYRWIRNTQELIAEGHPRAVEVWNAWKPTVMTPNPNLTDNDIASILAFIEGTYNGTIGGGEATTTAATTAPTETGLNKYWVIGGLAIALLALSLILWTILGKLNQVQAIQAGETPRDRTFKDLFTGRTAIGMYILLFVILGGYVTVNRAVDLNRQQDYQPDQPIKFSHVTHAGLNKIDCQYCHDGARRSKHALVPATNTCMNCHRAVRKGSKYGTGEITKIYASIGYDPSSDTYIEDYENLSQDEVKAVYTKWIADQYVVENEKLDSRGEALVENQWNHIVESLTTDVKKTVQGPIPWVKIHNLPDHVFFSHQQHVMAGGVACQTCHGPIEEMETVKQFSTLAMGWCINCHRETAVNFNNEYYEIYTHYHEEIKNGTRSQVTVDDIGGTECQKCHY